MNDMKGKVMSREKKKQFYNDQVEKMLKPNGSDIIMGILLLGFAITLGAIFMAAPESLTADKAYYRSSLIFSLADLVVAFAVLCKGLFYRWFSLTSIIARAKGIERSRVYPSQMYITALRVFTLMFCLVNIIILILVIKRII